jgi:Zn-dependent protease with chaperone function
MSAREHPEPTAISLIWPVIFLTAIIFFGIGVSFFFLWKPNFSPLFPTCVLNTDFQSPIDAELIAPFKDFETTELSQKIDATILRPLFDDTTTISHTVTSVEITENQFPDRPDFRRMIHDCARILGIKKPRVFVTDGPGRNAFAANFSDPIIVLHSSLLCRNVSDRELRFIIGHEMGHIKCAHIKWHTAIDIARSTLPEKIAAIALLPLLKWYRESEFSADNAGLLCCQDIGTAERALLRLELGLSELTIGHINVEEYLKQKESGHFGAIAEGVQLWREILSGHPFTPARIRQLRAYADSDRYQAVWIRKTQKRN